MAPKSSPSSALLSTLSTTIGIGGGSSATSAISSATSATSSLSRKAYAKEKRKRQRDAERVEKLRMLVSYLKSGSSQHLLQPLDLEPEELELAHERSWCWPSNCSSSSPLPLVNSASQANNCTQSDSNLNSAVSCCLETCRSQSSSKLFYISDDDDIIMGGGSAANTTPNHHNIHLHNINNNHHHDHDHNILDNNNDNNNHINRQLQLHRHHNDQQNDDERKQSDDGGSCDIHSCQLSSVGTASCCCHENTCIGCAGSGSCVSDTTHDYMSSSIIMNSSANQVCNSADMNGAQSDEAYLVKSSSGCCNTSNNIKNNNNNDDNNNSDNTIKNNNININNNNNNNIVGEDTKINYRYSSTNTSTASCSSSSCMNNKMNYDDNNIHVTHQPLTTSTDDTRTMRTSAWSQPHNLAAWIDQEVNSLVNDLEVKSQLLSKEKHAKSASGKCKCKFTVALKIVRRS